MKSTMQTPPLLISQILRYGTSMYADQEIATWTPEGARRISYREFGRQCAQFAHALGKLGVSGDDRVATFMWNNTEHAVAYLAVPAMGAVLHAWNIRLFPQQVVYIGNHSGAKVVVVDNSLAAVLAQMIGALPLVEHIIVNGPIDEAVRAELAAPEHVRAVHDWSDLLAGEPSEYDWPTDIDENDACSMCYTSGTTGNPKGVAYSNRANYLHSLTVAMTLGIRPGDRILVVVPLFHANAWGFPYTALMAGASLMMPDRYLQAEPLARFIEAERITRGAGVPTIWNDLLAYLETNPRDISSCTMLMVGGAPCPPSLMRAFDERHGIDIIHAWGMTEMTPVGTLAVPPPGLGVDDETYWEHRLSQGRLVLGVEARLIDEAGAEVPWDGQSVGELEVRGPWITGAYQLNGTEEAADRAEMEGKFNDGWLRTGDVGKLTGDGYLVLTDRSKDVIKSGGEWISSVDLENAIMTHPAVFEASVVGVEDQRWGERPLATVVLRPGENVTAAELHEFLVQKVAKWQVPERWVFIDQVPKTSVGKFDKKTIRANYAQGDYEVEQIG